MNNNLESIAAFMEKATGTDLSAYDEVFTHKILEKRMLLKGFKELADYALFFDGNIVEAQTLSDSMNISYSQFFRESLTYAVMEQVVIPELVMGRKTGEEIRIWSAGCADGREAYSIAMLISDFLESTGYKISFRILATDVSTPVIEEAKKGFYKESELANLKLKYRDKYFIKEGESYTINPELKKHLSFSVYDMCDSLTENPPESIYGNFDLVVCCNLLIYYKPEMQRVIIKKLKKATAKKGFLIVGEAEKMLISSFLKMEAVPVQSAVFKVNDKR